MIEQSSKSTAAGFNFDSLQLVKTIKSDALDLKIALLQIVISK